MGYYPIFLELRGRRCLVVGGGSVAEQKVRGLLAADADVTVVSPELAPRLQQRLAQREIRHVAREYRTGDVTGFSLVMVATDDGAVNALVAQDARRAGIWVNASDDPPNCDFILPSVIRKGEVVVAASTGGASPALARRIREDLNAFFAEDYGPLAELLSEVRLLLRARGVQVDQETWQHAIDARFRALVAQRRLEEAREHLLRGLGLAAEAAGDGRGGR